MADFAQLMMVVVNHVVFRGRRIVRGHGGHGDEGTPRAVGEGLAGVDALAATDGQDHVETDGCGSASEVGDAGGSDLAIEGDVVQFDVRVCTGVIQSRLDQAQDITVDDHHSLASAVRQISTRLSEHLRALDVSSG
ncbi:hypothetical protein D3C72_2004060 [compost metagenome]